MLISFVKDHAAIVNKLIIIRLFLFLFSGDMSLSLSAVIKVICLPFSSVCMLVFTYLIINKIEDKLSLILDLEIRATLYHRLFHQPEFVTLFFILIISSKICCPINVR